MKNLMKKMRLAVWGLLFGLLALGAQAQDYPMWQNEPMDFSVPIVAVGGDAALQNAPKELGPKIRSLSMLSVPQEMDAEVKALASSLGEGQAVAGEN
ncbi:MAG: hypothetical protein WCG66_13000, partial [bacterium]